MGISKQEMSGDSFDADLKKRGPKASKLSTKNLIFIVFALVILQVADAGIQWLAGGSASQQDTYMYAAVVFIITKCIYTKYAKSAGKGTVNEDEVAEEADAEEHPVTMVRDTMKAFRSVKSPPARKSSPAPNSHTPAGKKENWVPAWLKEVRPKTLNARAKKFMPSDPSNTLDSEAPLFLPTAQQVEEYQLLKSQSGGLETGAVMYRSRHWLNEICPDTKKVVKSSKSKSKSPQRYSKRVVDFVASQKAPKGSKPPEPRPKKKWQEKINPTEIKWTSACSTFKMACIL
eukprot:gnl/MRDRNA2_/MRDRNA2_107884_c0_seq1.p1 gnl/MRDRNA2_/MRDRNA2_107884_c0~~gnl/MRDRNA2_/MRDRNA2_107884_c0_seq1.p1  ORF type:complete len:288 (+),score=77.17 gnl/MRDRNA2_/MRDRNA2_107884_c0_seq1:105-968(+)